MRKADNLQKISRFLTIFVCWLGAAAFQLYALPVNPVPGQAWTDPASGIVFCYCPPGSFSMGSTMDDPDHTDDQMPRHNVVISKGFWLGKYEVTQSQWTAVMGSNPSRFKGKDRPVEMVRWNDCRDFITRLKDKTKNNYRLPTEAEWEYACGAGRYDKESEDLLPFAWFYQNSGHETNRVGLKRANSWGIHDMLGNVREWCQDFKGPYTSGSQADPQGPELGNYKVNRGGSWFCKDYALHRYYRWFYTPEFRDDDLGLRIIYDK